jgi:RHS repeat-associated protein
LKTKQGKIISRRDFLPFGEEIHSGTGGRNSAQGYGGGDSIRQKFTSYERDNETNLDYAKARMFGSGLGRFTSPDPLLSSGRIQNPQTWNRYVYVLNNPLILTDPLGLYEWADSAGGSWTDEELQTATRSRNKTVRKWAERATAFRQRFKEQLERAKTAATSDKLTLEQKQQVQESVDSYGDENDQNGVYVGIRVDYRGRSQTGGSAATALLNQDDTVSVNFRENLKDDEMVATIAHEGRHVADALNWVYSGHTTGGSTDLNHFFREERGWYVSSFIGQALNLKKVSAGTDRNGKSYEVWNRGWKELEIETKRANGINDIVVNHMRLNSTDTDTYSREHGHRPLNH